MGELKAMRTRHINRVGPILLLALIAASYAANPAWAMPKYKDLVIKKYALAGKKLDSCILCHATAGGGGARNAFGKAFQSAGMNEAALKTIAGKDSDGDGATNEAELKAGTFPGDAKSKPATAAKKVDVAPPAVDPLLGLWKHLGGDTVVTTAVAIKLTPEQTSGLKAKVVGTKDADIQAITIVKAKDAAGAPVMLVAHKLADGRYLGVTRNADGTVAKALIVDAKFGTVDAPYTNAFIGQSADGDWTAITVAEAPTDWDALLASAQRMLAVAALLAETK